jgi:hypothetical protein
MNNPLQFEANIIAGLDQIQEQDPAIKSLATDDPLFAFNLGKAKDANRHPAAIMNAALKAELVGDQVTADDYGLPMQNAAVVAEDDDEPVELSKELLAEIEKISGFNAKAAWSSVRRSLTKAVAQPLAKRAMPEPNFGKLLSTERRGRALVKIFEHGETWEIVE